MSGLITLVLILSPMFIGFLLPSRPEWVKMSETALGYLVFLLLIVIGIELGLVQDLAEKIGAIAMYLGVLMLLTLSSGVVALWAFDRFSPQHTARTDTQGSKPKVSLRGSLVQLICLAIGFGLAQILPAALLPPERTTTVLLMVLLFLVGISLKGSGVSLREAMLNKRGCQISVIFMAVTLLSGVIYALIFSEVSFAKALALASGFGWYSLSGTIMTDAYGAVWGSVALLNDLGREIVALIVIPMLMRHSTSAGIGLGGVTSLDFTLPTILQSGGTQIMPVVISFGFITNVVSPILMVLFSQLG